MAQTHKICTSCGYVGKAVFQISKMSSIKCPKCECLTMVALRSTEGQAILAQGAGKPRVWNDSDNLVGVKSN